MNEQAASLLHAIRETPDDDGPRLILADWFEDNGDPLRAEFIRTQVRLAGDPTAEERRVLGQREGELIESQVDRWRGPLGEKPWSGCSYERGTAVAKIQTSKLLTAKTQKQAADWFAPALVTHLKTEGTSSRWPAFFDLPLLEEVSHLTLSMSKMEPPGIEALARSPRLSNLRSLAIRNAASYFRGLNRNGMKALIDSPHLKQLTGLDFSDYHLDHESMELLTKMTPWPGLISLNIDNTPLHDHTLGLLLEAPWLSRLTHLSVYGCMGYDESVQWLVRDLAPTRLRYLGLGGNNVADGGAEVIAASAHLCELRELLLNFPKFTEVGAKALADSPHLGQLQMLYVYNLRADSPAAKILRERFGDVVQTEWSPRG